MNGLANELKEYGQVVLVLQGGGALGAYQVGVYQALHEAGIEPDWVIGTSIGAINASIIAGNPFATRLDRLTEFWKRVEQSGFMGAPAHWLGAVARNFQAISTGIPGFFKPNPLAFVGPHTRLGTDAAGYYSVEPLRRTLSDLVDFDHLAKGAMRLTVGASNVRTAQMHYFDSRETELRVDHVLASGALPPAFPAVRIDGELYWDGGILSNTPIEVVFDDNPRRDGVVFAVHIWNPHGDEPETIWQVMNRHKDVQYSSRAVTHIKRQRQLHRLRHVVAELLKLLPPEVRISNEVAQLAAYGCLTRMHVVRLVSPALPGEDHLKDIDFSPEGIGLRREAGYRHTLETLRKRPWRDPHDPMEGLVLHETLGGELMETPPAY